MLREHSDCAAKLGTWVLHRETGSIEWSDEMYRILGFEPRSVTPGTETFFAAVEPMDRIRVREEALRALEHGDFRPSEFTLLRADGYKRRVRLQAAYVAGPEGPKSYVVGTFIDVTDGRGAGASVFRNADELEWAQGVARMGSFTWKVKPARLEWSPGMYRLLGLNGDETPTEELFHRHVHPDDLTLLLTKRREALDAGMVPPFEFRIVSEGGTVLHVELECQALRDEDGTFLGFRGVLQDVTRRRAIEQQQRHAQKMEAIGTLAGGVAHDFNNYLMILGGEAELLRTALGPGHPLLPGVAAILDACTRCTALTEQLLNLSRRHKGSPGSANLSALVRRLVPVLRTAIGDAIQVELQEDEADAWIVADEGQAEQVLMNLALNARDAMPRGGLMTIAVERVLRESSGSCVRLTVTDTGEGIAPEHRDRIFEPFFTTKAGRHGTGLGLSTVYGIVKDAGGYIEVDSEVGKGTSFRVDWLPAKAPLPLTDSTAPPALASSASLTVLVVEDMDEVRALLRKQLEQAGHRVCLAEHGVAALALLERRDDIDVVLSDAVMPIMGGVELERRIRTLYPEMAFVLMTAYADGLFPEREARKTLRKPVSIRQLLETLREVCVHRLDRDPLP